MQLSNELVECWIQNSTEHHFCFIKRNLKSFELFSCYATSIDAYSVFHTSTTRTLVPAYTSKPIHSISCYLYRPPTCVFCRWRPKLRGYGTCLYLWRQTGIYSMVLGWLTLNTHLYVKRWAGVLLPQRWVSELILRWAGALLPQRCVAELILRLAGALLPQRCVSELIFRCSTCFWEMLFLVGAVNLLVILLNFEMCPRLLKWFTCLLNM